MLKQKFAMFWMFVCMLLLVGCFPKTMITESGAVVPSELKNAYFFLDYSQEVSDLVGKVTADLYLDGFLDEKMKNEIGKVWTDHKYYHNLAQKEVDKWYVFVSIGQGEIDTEKLVLSMSNILQEAKLLEELVYRFSDGTIKVPGSLLSNLEKLYTLVKEGV